MFKRRYLSPLVSSVIVGAIWEYIVTWRAIQDKWYIQDHLYNAAAREIVDSLNHRVLVLAGLFYSIQIALAIDRRLGGSKRKWYRLVTVLGFTAVLYYLFDMTHLLRTAWSHFDLRIVKYSISDGFPQIALVPIVLVGGFFLLKCLRARNLDEKNGGLPTSTDVPRFSKLHAVLIALPLAVFVGLNAVSLYLKTMNSIPLRSNPNIVFIMVDTLRADHLGCYGYFRNTTPNIDKLSQDSVRFSKAISQASWTNPSVASFMTGRYLRVGEQSSFAPQGVPFLSEVLKDHGYTTAAVVSNPFVVANSGYSRGYDYFEERWKKDITSPDVFRSAVETLDRIKSKRFFMFLLFIDPHSPYHLHPEHNFYPENKGRLGSVLRIDAKADDWSPEDMKYVKSVYDSEIAFTDEYLGKFLDKLKKENLYNDTLIIFLSDHGDGFKEHGLLTHGNSLYDELVSIPLIIKLPGQRTRSVVQGTFPLIDLFPTIMNRLHYNTSSLGLQGSAVSLDGLKKVDAGTTYASTSTDLNNLESLRTTTHKYIRDMRKNTEQLFDLANDPGEKKNIALQRKGLAAEFHKLLQDKDRDIDAALQNIGNDETPSSFSPEQEQRLHGLGYLNR